SSLALAQARTLVLRKNPHPGRITPLKGGCQSVPMRRFFASLTVLGWLLLLLTGAATVGFVVALNTWYGGFNSPDWPWHHPDRPVWTRADYLLIPLFALVFFGGVGYLLSRLGLAVFRDDPSGESADSEGGKQTKRKRQPRK